MLRGISQAQKASTSWSHLCVESKELGFRQSREWIGGYQGLEFEGKEMGIYLKNTNIYINWKNKFRFLFTAW